jgi:hypothetical protein
MDGWMDEWTSSYLILLQVLWSWTNPSSNLFSLKKEKKSSFCPSTHNASDKHYWVLVIGFFHIWVFKTTK